MKELLYFRKRVIIPTIDDHRLVDIVNETTFIRNGTTSSVEYQKWRFEVIKKWSIDPQAIQITGGPKL